MRDPSTTGVRKLTHMERILLHDVVHLVLIKNPLRSPHSHPYLHCVLVDNLESTGASQGSIVIFDLLFEIFGSSREE